MNRHSRRRLQALAVKAPLPPARADGRPLYYTIGGTDLVHCFKCLQNGLYSLYGYGQAFMNDPANSPDGSGDMHTICHHHLPDNAVIYHPTTNKCTDKSGQNSWEEAT